MAAAARQSATALNDEITPRTASERALQASLAACAAKEEAELTGRMDAVETAAAATAQREEDNEATIAALHARIGELNAQVEARQQDRATIAALEKRCVELEGQLAAHGKGEGEVHTGEQNNENVVNRAPQRFIVERI
jgi:chromosome segregation ATPase